MGSGNGMTYEDAGVVSIGEEGSFKTLLEWVSKSMEDHPEVKAQVGLYATVIDVGQNIGIAMSTDGVGTKLLVAQLMDRYYTVGIDCVAMNVNDLICVGARPIAMLDYIAVEDATSPLLGDLGKGLYEGAKMAGISIPAGEVAQLREMIKGAREGYGFDLVGTAFGVVPMDMMVVGEGIVEGDAVVGVASSGLHSNGYTLARKVLLDRGPDAHFDELGMSAGEALLEPTRIYVRPALELLDAVDVKALIHITGEGFRNLQRVRSQAGFVLDDLPEPPPIFRLIQERGRVGHAEMFNTFNMGVGLAAVVPEDQAERAIAAFQSHGMESRVIGRAVADPERKVLIPSHKLVGREDRFHET